MDPAYVKELRTTTKLLTRTVHIAKLARLSPSRTTVVWESPARRSIEGTPHHCDDLPLHSTVFDTSLFKQLVAETESVSPWSSSTFAWCRFHSDAQKYTTFWFTSDASLALSALDEPQYQCNHAGKHARIAGGKLPDGRWASEDFTAFPDALNSFIARAATQTRTGSPEAMPAPAPSRMIYTSRAPEQAEPIFGTTHHAGPSTPSAPPDPGGPSPVSFAGFGSPGAPSTGSPLYVPFEAARSAARLGPRDPARHATRDMRTATRGQRPDQLPSLPEDPDIDIEGMEAMVAKVIARASGTPRAPTSSTDPTPLDDWIDIPTSKVSLLAAKGIGQFSLACDDPLVSALGITRDASHTSLVSSLDTDPEIAPANEKEATRLGGKWDTARSKELGNHSRNGSWERITRSKVPPGRAIHKLVWVFKVKRDGTAKARLCVQGCTMVHGKDYNQVFADTLRISSARSLFAYAARYGCKVHSVDWVSAYLQGELLEGEVVYTHMPPGHTQYDSHGKPYVLKVVKPIYGIPQAGRRFQRSIFPWLRAQGFRQLDSSDSCVWVYDPEHAAPSREEPPNAPVTETVREPPSGDTCLHASALAAYHTARGSKERLVLGVYVDNLQIVHSSEASDTSSQYSQFMTAIARDWDVEDEGEMVDLLGIEIKRNSDGSITLHMKKYIRKLLAEFLPDGTSPGISRKCLPYSKDLASIVGDASHAKTLSPGRCLHPELLEAYQKRLGCLMYLTNSVRPDLAYVIGMHCRNMSNPTPELLRELDYVFCYLARHDEVGLTFSATPTEMHGFTDASLDVGKSTSGYLVMWQGAAVSWGSSKQKSTALSSCEAEIYALSEGAKDVVYFRKLLSGLGENMESPTSCATDNKGAADLAHNPEHHRRSKHIERRHFYIRDMVEALELRVPLVRTHEDLADMLTKVLAPREFFRWRALIMNEPESFI